MHTYRGCASRMCDTCLPTLPTSRQLQTTVSTATGTPTTKTHSSRSPGPCAGATLTHTPQAGGQCHKVMLAPLLGLRRQPPPLKGELGHEMWLPKVSRSPPHHTQQQLGGEAHQRMPTDSTHGKCTSRTSQSRALQLVGRQWRGLGTRECAVP